MNVAGGGGGVGGAGIIFQITLAMGLTVCDMQTTHRYHITESE